MAKSRLDFSNPLLSPAAVGSLSNTEEREPTEKRLENDKHVDFSNTEQKEPTGRKRKGPARKPDVIRNEDGGNSAQEGLNPANTRFSCICKVENVKKVKDYAYTQRIPIRQAMDEIIESFFEDYSGDLLDHSGKGE